MTKISSKSAYPKKTPIVSDYFVGTDSENFSKTVNFGFEATAGLINKLNGTPILNYVFSTSPYLSTEVLLEGRFLSDENELSTPLLTKLHVNKFNNSGDNLSELYSFLKTNATDFYMKLRNSNNQNNAVYFNISSIDDFTDYFVFNIAVFKENEFLPTLDNLNIYFFDFELKAKSASDPLKLDKSTYTGNAQDLDTRIDILENEVPSSYAKIVYVNGTTPNTATIFDLNTPPVTNNDLLKLDTNNLYIGTDASTWLYNGIIYITKLIPNSSNFFINGSTADAGAGKTSNIYRSGTITAPSFIKTGGLSTEFLKADGSVDSNTYATSTDLALKLDASAYNQHFLGVYVTLSALNLAHPTASVGDYAQVNEVGATDVVNYNWDAEDGIWVAGGGTGGATNTDALPEGSTNLYWTVSRFLANLTATNIKSALGITTLSGSNTGDQDLSGKQNTIMDVAAFSGNIDLSKLNGTNYGSWTCNSNAAITSSNEIDGGFAELVITGNGINSPDLSAWTSYGNITNFDDRLGIENCIGFFRMFGKKFYSILNTLDNNVYYSKVLSILGVNNNISIANTNYPFTTSTPFTIRGKFKYTTGASFQTIFSLNNGTLPIIQIYLNSVSNAVYLLFNGATSGVYKIYGQASASISPNVWQDICVSYDGTFGASSMTLRVGNVSKTTTVAVNSFNSSPTGINTLTIGKDIAGSVQSNGLLISDLVIINKALSSTEMDEAYNSGMNANFTTVSFASNVISWHKFDNNLSDSKNSNHGSAITPLYSSDVPL